MKDLNKVNLVRVKIRASHGDWSASRDFRKNSGSIAELPSKSGFTIEATADQFVPEGLATAPAAENVIPLRITSEPVPKFAAAKRFP